MFFLETKDGDKFFTDSKSDDKVEFWKILDQKLGRPAAVMFDEFIKDAEYLKNEDAVESVADDLDDITSALSNMDNIDKSAITPYINKLKKLSSKLRRLL